MMYTFMSCSTLKHPKTMGVKLRRYSETDLILKHADPGNDYILPTIPNVAFLHNKIRLVLI